MTTKNKLLPLILLSTLFLLTSCKYIIIAPSDPFSGEYREENKAQYSAANYSILGMKTHESDKVIILEEDNYGRTLCFLRTKTYFSTDKYIAAIFITQADDESSSAFFEFDNILYCYTDFFQLSEDIHLSFFSNEKIEQLKEKNNWGLNKVLTRDVYCSDYHLELVSKKEIEHAITTILGDDEDTFYDPLNKYSNGKIVYLIGRPKFESTSTYEKEYYIVVFSKDSTEDEPKYVYEKIDDIYNCQTQLKALVYSK